MRRAGIIAGLALMYFVSARLEELFLFSRGHTAPLWVPTGVALGALLLAGLRFWPFVPLGVFAASVGSLGIAPAAAIAAGDTLAVVGGVWLLTRKLGFRPAINRTRDILSLIVVGALGTALLSAVVATFATRNHTFVAGLFWWLGDAAGIVTLTPAILAWAEPQMPRDRRETEALLVAITTALVTVLVFSSINNFPMAFVPFPLVAWSSVRFGQRGATAMSLLVTVVAALGTAQGHGPFGGMPHDVRLFHMFVFQILLTGTSLLMAALTSEREQLTQSLELLATAVNGAEDGILVAEAPPSPRAKVVFVSDGFARLTGYAEHEVPSRLTALLLGFSGTPEARFNRTRRARGMRIAGETSITRRDGTEYSAEWQAAPVMTEEGGVSHYVSVHRNITSRKRVENELRYKETLLRSVMAAAPIAYSVVDRETDTILFYNERFCELWAVPPALRGKLERGEMTQALLFVECDANAERTRAISQASPSTYEHELDLRDGRTIRHFTTLIGSDGAGHVGRLHMFEDVTAKLALQGKLIAAERLASMGTVAAGVAHEINNPLTVVVANLSLLADEVSALEGKFGTEDFAAIRELLGDTATDANLIRGIVADMKAFSRDDSEDARDDESTADLVRVFDLATGLAGKDVRLRATLERDTPADLPIVRGAERRLAQVFVNLLINAAQAIDGAPERNLIGLRARRERDRVLVDVEDSGRGISPEDQLRIFEPFFTTKLGEGTGLGLYVSHGIVTAIGGTISVESSSAGTRFRVSLPIAHERPDAPRPAAEEPQP